MAQQHHPHFPPPWQLPPTRLPTLVQADPSQHLPLPLPLAPRPGGAPATAAPESAAALLPPLSASERSALRALGEDAQAVRGVLDALRGVDLAYMCVLHRRLVGAHSLGVAGVVFRRRRRTRAPRRFGE